MNRIRIEPVLALLASAFLTGPGVAQTAKQDPPKERPKAEQPKEAQKSDAPDANPREVAKKAAHFESVHRDRIARIDRLIVIYTKKGDRAKVEELQKLREMQLKRHENGMAGFHKQLGDEHWGRFEKELKGPNARARAVRNEHANENEREREARKAAKDGKPEEKPGHEKSDKPKEDAPKRDHPKGKPGGEKE